MEREIINQRESALLLRVKEVIALLNMGRGTVYSMVASGELPTVRHGRSVRVPKRALEAWIERNTIGGAGGVPLEP